MQLFSHVSAFCKYIISLKSRKLLLTIPLLLLAVISLPSQPTAQTAPVVFSLPLTISNQGIAFDVKTLQIIATDYKNDSVLLVKLLTGATTTVLATS